MPRTRQQARGYWPLTRAACKAAKIPHQRRRVIREGRVDAVICELCGARLEKVGRVKKAA